MTGGGRKKPGEKTFMHHAEWTALLEHELEWLPAAGTEPGEKFLTTDEARRPSPYSSATRFFSSIFVRSLTLSVQSSPLFFFLDF